MLDLFTQINNAVLDLQASDYQGYARPLKTLGRLLRHESLADTNAALTADLDVEEFIVRSEDTQGGMAGSARLDWPDDKEKEIGLALLLIDRLSADPDFALNFAHNFFYTSSGKLIASIHAMTGQMIIPFVRDYKAHVMNHGSSEPRLRRNASTKVFVVHGHDDGAREAVARFLEKLGFEAVILHEQANLGRTIIEKFVAHGDVGFAVVLLTPDDVGCEAGGTPRPRARQNVVLELGYFVGRLGRERVLALRRGDVELPSDIAGVVYETLDQAGAWRGALSRELQAAGYPIDWNKIMGA